MKIAWYKVKTLFIKDIKNLLRNPNVAFMLILPIGFALLYGKIMTAPQGYEDELKNYIFNLCTLLNVGVVPISIVAMCIAEEKEKFTLRTLILSNVSAVEFLIDKVLVGLVLFLIENILIFFVCKLDFILFPKYMLILIITAISALLFGAAVGLIAKDQMSTGYYSTPVMLLFMSPIFGMMNDTIAKIVRFIPTNSMIEFFNMKQFSELISKDGLISIAVVVGWIIVSVLVFVKIYRKNILDN